MHRKSLVALIAVVFLIAKAMPDSACKSDACAREQARLKNRVKQLRQDMEEERRMRLKIARERDGHRANENHLHRRLNEYEMSQAELHNATPSYSGVDEVSKIRKG